MASVPNNEDGKSAYDLATESWIEAYVAQFPDQEKPAARQFAEHVMQPRVLDLVKALFETGTPGARTATPATVYNSSEPSRTSRSRTSPVPQELLRSFAASSSRVVDESRTTPKRSPVPREPQVTGRYRPRRLIPSRVEKTPITLGEAELHHKLVFMATAITPSSRSKNYPPDAILTDFLEWIQEYLNERSRVGRPLESSVPQAVEYAFGLSDHKWFELAVDVAVYMRREALDRELDDAFRRGFPEISAAVDKEISEEIDRVLDARENIQR